MNIDMKYLVVAISCLISGCASPVWIGENIEKDLYECRIEAVNLYPPAMYSQQIGVGQTSPAYTSCNVTPGFAACTTTGGGYTPPPVITADANSGSRDGHLSYCMTRRGNRLIAKSEYDNFVAHKNNGETPVQRKIRLREECRRENGYKSTLCTNENDAMPTAPYSYSVDDESPVQRKMRLAEECRKANGHQSLLCAN